ncbi:conserved hypothetical protein [Ixodes scapularis]|uniref:Peptidase M13 C-terminal domain-containing protein n=1 Tax=Ixodes scapularis TaxID=6945 RepID=B7QFJ9_IXOSC|nr:conserved hypothetical protein [Ixodes scapularis]|eukprot:XP_002414313.1 conserved hypothetical protein [Ixodes scapularis]
MLMLTFMLSPLLPSGSQFDADGELRNWWTESAEEEFLKRAQCFIDQYSNVTVKEVNLTVSDKKNKTHILTQEKPLMLSDKGQKYLHTSHNENILSRIIEHKNVHNEVILIIFVILSLLSAKHSSNTSLQVSYSFNCFFFPRVNLPLGNSPDFLRVFSCSPNSTMNIKKKCPMW